MKSVFLGFVGCMKFLYHISFFQLMYYRDIFLLSLSTLITGSEGFRPGKKKVQIISTASLAEEPWAQQESVPAIIVTLHSLGSLNSLYHVVEIICKLEIRNSSRRVGKVPQEPGPGDEVSHINA